MRGLEVVSPKPPPQLGDDASDYLLHPLDQLVTFFQQMKVDKKKNDNYFFSAKIYYWVGAPQQSMSQMADSCSRVSIMVHFLKGNKGWSTNAGLNRSLEMNKFKKKPFMILNMTQSVGVTQWARLHLCKTWTMFRVGCLQTD